MVYGDRSAARRAVLFTILIAWSIVLAYAGASSAQNATTRVYDTFTGTNGQTLPAHQPDVNVPNHLWRVDGTPDATWGTSSDLPVPGDYDGDHLADIAIWRPSTGVWWILLSGTNYNTTNALSIAFGASTDLPVPGDYDGDGRTDLAVYRPSTGQRFVRGALTNFTATYNWGISTDVPVVADFDGDHESDIAIYRPSDHGWYALLSTFNYDPNHPYVQFWGDAGDVPIAGDYDGDGMTDVAVYRPSTGMWYALRSSNGTTMSYQWGNWSGPEANPVADIPVPGDYDGDHKTDLALYRPTSGEWWILQSGNDYNTNAPKIVQWGNSSGLSGAIAAAGDYDGDSTVDVAVFEPSSGEWYVVYSTGAELQSDEVGLRGLLPGIQVATIDGGAAANTSVAAKWRFPGATKWGGVVLRFSDDNHFLLAEYQDGGVLRLRRRNDGNWTTVQTATVVAAGTEFHRLRAAAIGSLIRVYWDDVLQIEATDGVGLTGNGAGLAWKGGYDALARADVFQVDANVPPEVALASPTGTDFQSPATIPLEATASDLDGSVARVDFFANGTLIGSDSQSPYAMIWSNVGSGAYAVVAKAFDNVGEPTASSSITIHVTDPVPCTFTISPTQATIGSSGGNGSPDVTVTASRNDCAWTTSNGNFQWVHLTAGGTGSGVAGWSVDQNQGAQRVAAVTIAEATFTVAQDAAPCVYDISPTSDTIGWSGGSKTVHLSTRADCSWTATTSDSWLHIQTSSGIGTADVGYTVDQNEQNVSRTAHATIGTRLFTQTQDPNPNGYSTCSAANPHDNNPDDDALNACLAAGGEIRLEGDAFPGYLIASGLYLNVAHTKLRGTGNGGAHIKAAVELRAPMLRTGDVDDYELSHLQFDGNRDNREWDIDCIGDYNSRTHGYNLFLTGSGFLVEHVTSKYAMCGSAMEVSGRDYRITANHIISNGWSEDERPLPIGYWSDGITLLTCGTNSEVWDNDFSDNTDIDLIVGPDPGCYVHDNRIEHNVRYGFGGLMVGFGGNHAGARVQNNTVTSGYNLLAFGVMVGQHPWDDQLHTADTGDVSENTSSGAVVNLAIDGVYEGSILSNHPNNAQGNHGFNGCNRSADYTAAHIYGNAQIQTGPVFRFYDPNDPGRCGP